jgi:hypothetical protein
VDIREMRRSYARLNQSRRAADRRGDAVTSRELALRQRSVLDQLGADLLARGVDVERIGAARALQVFGEWDGLDVEALVTRLGRS